MNIKRERKKDNYAKRVLKLCKTLLYVVKFMKNLRKAKEGDKR